MGITKRHRWKIKPEINIDAQLLSLLNNDLSGAERIAAHEFFLTLAACNTVIPMVTHNSANSELDEDVEVIDYQGESPDEQALVAAAAAYGYTLVERTSGHIVVDVNGERLRLELLGLHEFDSVRKRMSVVIKFPNNAVKVLVKGADTSMFSVLAEVLENSDLRDAVSVNIQNATQNHLTEYSSQGLRTLVIAARDLADSELEEWQCRYEEASTSLVERSTKLRQTSGLIEHELTLLGATAIEDKLQDGVPETIESLRQAGIKVWVLTGDKQETAICIGLSCKLLTQNMQQIIINGSSEEECRQLLTAAKAKYGIQPAKCKHKNLKRRKNVDSEYVEIPDDRRAPEVSISVNGLQVARHVRGSSSASKEDAGRMAGITNIPLALIIDGNSLVYILEKDLEPEAWLSLSQHIKMLFDLATACRVVLCCRVAPLQKAGIVDLIKSRTNDMTLAVGDGANDVSMIQMADVGVGICGQEGRQAVMASDFAMGQFRFLKRLLLVHGHWNYQRVGYLDIGVGLIKLLKTKRNEGERPWNAGVGQKRFQNIWTSQISMME
ncbi:hypothetical protein ACLOJK_031483 [Asimina triloba]